MAGGMALVGMAGTSAEHAVPDWRRVLVVVAHPDDESFGWVASSTHSSGPVRRSRCSA